MQCLALGHVPAVELALGVDHFNNLGLISLEDRFREIKAKAIAPSEKRRG